HGWSALSGGDTPPNLIPRSPRADSRSRAVSSSPSSQYSPMIEPSLHGGAHASAWARMIEARLRGPGREVHGRPDEALVEGQAAGVDAGGKVGGGGSARHLLPGAPGNRVVSEVGAGSHYWSARRRLMPGLTNGSAR